jgi:AAA domain, putative AbiEii toxin, Type IV TA system
VHIRGARLVGFKRFADLTIAGLAPTARLVVLAGPNGTGKSSLFDGFRTWHGWTAPVGNPWEEAYHLKRDPAAPNTLGPNQRVQVDFFEPLPADGAQLRGLLYFRTAYRHEADFTTSHIARMGSILDATKINRMIDVDTKVADNYQRLITSSVDALYGGQHDSTTVKALREDLIGPLRESMSRLFDDLIVRGLGDPLQGGSFYFEKGTAKDFHYRNLSGGEKAAFDLILDVFAKRDAYPEAVWCIDEPELHLNTRLQAQLLEELLNLLPAASQIWIASHSIGMMRKAWDIQRASPDAVQFLDFESRDFDSPVVMQPVPITRVFWQKTLQVALDDLANLVAPAVVVLCEGAPTSGSGSGEFDAACYRQIFGNTHPDTDFISVGNEHDVHHDKLRLGQSIQALITGTNVIRLVDRDSKTSTEIRVYGTDGVRVLSRRHLEAYLLDDEVIERLCISTGHPEATASLIEMKRQLLGKSVDRGKAPDDHKSIAGELQVEARKLLRLTIAGSNAEAFMRDVMAPLITTDTGTYSALETDIFG